MSEADAGTYDMATCTPSYIAQIDYYVSQNLYGHIESLTSDLLNANPTSQDYTYWHAFAQIQQQQYHKAYTQLEQLFANPDYSLPSISLALQCTHITRVQQDKLRGDIKAASKQSTVHALALAARYFVHINKLHKAKQCIEKALTKNKRHIGLIALYGLINIKVAEAIDCGTAESELTSNGETAETVLEKGLLTCKKALKCSQLSMDICALITRVNGLAMQKKYDKALHDINTTIKIHNDFTPAVEVRAQLLCATDQWSEAITTATNILSQNRHSIAALRVLLSYSVMRSNGDAVRLAQFNEAISTTEPHSQELRNEYNEFRQRMNTGEGYDENAVGHLSDIVEGADEKQTPEVRERTLQQRPEPVITKTQLVTQTTSPISMAISDNTSRNGLTSANGRDSRSKRNTININDATTAVMAAGQQTNLLAAKPAQNRIVTTPRASHMEDTLNNVSAIQQQHDSNDNDDVNDWVRRQRLHADAEQQAAATAAAAAEQARLEQKRFDEMRRLEELDRQREQQRQADEQRALQSQQAMQRQQRRMMEQKVEKTVDLDDIPTIEDGDMVKSYANPVQNIDVDTALPYRRPAAISTETAAQRIARNKTLTSDHFLPTDNAQKYGTLQRQPSLKQVAEQTAAEKAEADKRARIALAAQQIEQAKQFVKSAFYGEQFIKYGRRGSPHERTLTIEVNGRVITLDWGSGKISSTKDGIKLLDGKQTAVMLGKSAKKAKPEMCFSLVFADRTLDLECKTTKIKEYWWNGFQLLLKYLK